MKFPQDFRWNSDITNGLGSFFGLDNFLGFWVNPGGRGELVRERESEGKRVCLGVCVWERERERDCS